MLNRTNAYPAPKPQMPWGGFPWFALQVRGQREEAAANHLEGKGYELFLPMYRSRRAWSDRVKEVELPLFPGYLFCRFDLLDRLPILQTPGVISIVGHGRMAIAVDEGEIRAIQTLIASGLPNRSWPFMKTGDRVQIQSGPLRGLEGILAGFKKNYVVLSITLLQRSVAVEIDSCCVTAVGRVEENNQIDERHRELLVTA